jgi:hypothetical protein
MALFLPDDNMARVLLNYILGLLLGGLQGFIIWRLRADIFDFLQAASAFAGILPVNRHLQAGVTNANASAFF